MSGDNGLVLRVAPEDLRVAEARARLIRAREHTHDALAALRTDLAEQIDWRTWVRARPGLFLTAAFFAGFFLARRR